MKASELPMRGLGDARLAVHAASGLPAWLWSVDGTHILWANPVGASLFGASGLSQFDDKTFGPADPHRRQVAQLANRLRPDGPPRLERLRGFGAAFGRLVTCACTRLRLSDGSEAILIAAVEAVGRAMPLGERLQRLVENADIPLAAFGRDGVFVGASEAARALLGFRNLSEAGLAEARDEALRTGRTETPVGLGHLVLQRVGSGAEIGLIALLQPGTQPATPLQTQDAPQVTDTAEPILHAQKEDVTDVTAGGEAPAEFLLVDEFAEHDDDAPAPLADIPPSEPEPAEEPVAPRTVPLRFVWETNIAGHFALHSEELLALLGPEVAASLDRAWSEIAASGVDPEGHVTAAIAAQSVWSGINVTFPADGLHERVAAELTGIPAYRNGEFSGYRGFGIVRDLDKLTHLEILRAAEASRGPLPQSLSAHSAVQAPPVDSIDLTAQKADEIETRSEESVTTLETPPNVVHFRGTPDGSPPVLTPVENSAFNELARELSARLEAEMGAPVHLAEQTTATAEAASIPATDAPSRSGAHVLLDANPAPIAVYRNDELLYANPAFVALTSHADLASLRHGGFDISSLLHAKPIALDWDGAPAQGIILAATAPAPQVLGPESGSADAEDLGGILDATDEAVLMFDGHGTINACNRSAAKLFGVHGDAMVGHDVASLFTPDTQVAITPLRERLGTTGEQTVDARTIVGGAELPLKLTMGLARPGGSNFYAIVRDLTAQKTGEAELAAARRLSARASADKADILSRISHEMRAPLSAIIGFADVMIEQRFGPLGNDRYADYLRDIRSCGERVVAIVDDLLDLARIESGKRDLVPAPQDLNHLVEQCVAAMQPQANRERIIIRSSLAHPLPEVLADAQALRQITLNLIGNSIHLANPGGQVIVSTVHADSGDVLLRVRDTGHGLNDNEVATALAPFRPASEDDVAPAQIRLSLTRALAEANQARFTVKPAPYAGTLIEIAFAGQQR